MCEGAYVCVCAYVCMYVCVCLYVCMCERAYVCVCEEEARSVRVKSSVNGTVLTYTWAFSSSSLTVHLF
jgi:hypothetical protein